MKRIKLKKKWIKILAVIAATITIGGVTFTFAMPDESDSVHIDASEIEDSTLIIGSHLIYLGSLNDQIYEIATESAAEFNQYNTYYKSEIAGGTWYEISNATVLADITTEGVIVDESEIEALSMTHHTKSDGITYDLLTNQSVSVFDIEDPYNLEEMEELEPIKLQYDVLKQLEDPSDTNERDILYIEEIYNKDRRTEVTDQLDQNIDALQKYYEILVNDGADSDMSDRVLAVMEKLDAERRAEVLAPLNESELQTMSNVIGREFVYIEGEITGEFVMSEDRKERAEQAAAIATAGVQAQIDTAKQELEDLRTRIETKAAEAADAVREDWALRIEEEQDEEKKAELIESMEQEAAQAAEETKALYSEELETKEQEVSTLEAEADTKKEEAGKLAIESVMNEERETLENFILNTDLVNAIGEAMDNVQESYIDYSAQILEEGSTVLSKTEYRLTQELIGFAKEANYSECDKVVKQLIYLNRVNNSIILEEELEREFIASELLEDAVQAYKDSLSAGVGESYQMLSTMASAATKANVLKSQMNETEVIRNELQFIQQAYIDRMSSEDATAYLTECIDNMDSFREGIQEDAFAEYASSSVDTYSSWLNSTLNAVQNATGQSEMDSLMNRKEELQTELMSAWDKNQLDKAKEIDAQIEAIDKQIEELENQLNEILNSDNTSDSEKALAAAQLGTGSSLAALQEMKDNALEELREGNLDGIENIIDGIGALAETQPEGALRALEDIYKELVNQELLSGGSSELDELMSKVEDVTAQQMDNFLNDLSDDDLSSLIESFIEENSDDGIASDSDPESLEDVMDALSDQDMAMVLAGLGMYAGQKGTENTSDVVETYSKVAQNNGNDYVFEKYNADPTMEYIPSDQLAKIMGFRYIFNDSQKAVTLQKNSQFYKFTAFSNVMQNGTEEQETTKAVGFSSVIYIPKDVAETYFSLTVLYLDNTSSGVILTEEMNEQANAFLDYLLEAGGF